MKSVAAIISLATTALAAVRTTAPSGCITVATDGSGNYKTIQSAVNSLSTSASSDQCIFIQPGTYNEQVTILARSARLSIYGYTQDTTSYSGNMVTITSSLSQANGLSNDETATLRVKATNFKLYNINVNNGYGKGSQAVALSAYADSGYYGCKFTGYQDTLLANQGYQYYSACLIQGATDFIFGQYSPAWFEKCDIRVLQASLGFITANGRTASNGPSYYVFNNCNIAAASGNTVPSGAYYLGRPWSQWARVVFQNTAMSNVINSAGWRIWNTGDERTSGVLFGEYKNSGDGSKGTRASFATALSKAVAITDILGSSYKSAGYFDTAYA